MKDELNEISLNGTVYDFSLDHSSIKQRDILNIYEYLIVKNNKKIMFDVIQKQLLWDYYLV